MSSQQTSSPAASDSCISSQVAAISSNPTSVTSSPITSPPNGRTPDKTIAPNASFNERLGSEIVKISVGEGIEKQEFHIHKNLLCQKAPVFDRMLNGNFAEGRSGEASLPEDDPRAFDMLVSWLYSGSVLNHACGDFIRIFILAEKYGIVCLADNTMDAFIQSGLRSRKRPGAKYWAQAYEGTHEGSKLRLFMSRCWAYGVINQGDNEKWATCSLAPTGEKAQEILIDGMGLLRNMNNSKLEKGQKLMCNPKYAPACDYHQHGKDEACPYAKLPKRKLDEINV
ncbi:hypothetical protein DL98DRAFT_487740 [Cadophora sp. DSE1049]|nr:hypothetical protein DL98DRAFT_487740 [Cadophora sp. DSE1049]